MKKLLIVVAILVVIAVAGVVLLVSNMDALARKGIIAALEYVLQVDVELERVEIAVREGQVDMYKLKIGNPEGFDGSESFSFTQATAGVDIQSFKTDQPVIRIVAMKDATVTIEQNMNKNNYKALIDNASRLAPADDGKPKEDKPEEPKKDKRNKKIVVDKVAIENTSVQLSSPLLQDDLKYTLGSIEMVDIGREGGSTDIASALKEFLAKIMEKAIEEGGGNIPDDVMKNLQGNWEDIKGKFDEEALQKNLDDARESLKEGATDKAKERLQNLFD
ncbi:MAG: hypothetical protein ACLFUS_14975 [Candidatus Sumerlaeia bacterium]